MKFKFLLVSSSLALASFSAYFFAGNERKESDYTPREKQTTSSYLDAVPYLKMLRGNLETGEFMPADYGQMARAVSDYDRLYSGDRSQDLSWWEMGPDNIGGRTRAICAINNDLIFTGAVTGGVYKSMNGGNNWTRVESLDIFQKTMAVSAIDRTGDGTLYVATGSAFESGFGGDGSSGAVGVGLYMSTDLGETWSLVPGTDPTEFSSTDDWAFINDICADPNVPGRLWIAANAGTGYWEPGMTEPDMTITGLPSSQNGHDIDWAVDGSYCLIGVANGRVYRSTDGGNSFAQVGSSILTSKQRVRVAISADDVSKAYVLYAQGGFMGGVYYTPDGGNNWEEKWPTGVDNIYSAFGFNGQGYYDLALTVKPGDPSTCIVGGVTLWKAGASTQPEQIAYNFEFGGSEYYVHSDIHTFEVAPNGDLYIGCDGGIFKSIDGGMTFAAMNRGYNVTQFYGIAHSPGYPVMGGTQDNGTILIPGMAGEVAFETVSWQQGIEVSGGDGFDCELNQITVPGARVAFTTSYTSILNRFNEQGAGGAFYDNEVLAAIGSDGEAGPFYNTVRLFENTADDNSEQYVILTNNRNEDIYSYLDDNGDPVWVDTTLYTLNLTLPFSYRFPLGDTLHFWPTLVRPEIFSTELLTEDPNYPWLDPQELTETIDSCITDSILVGMETVIDEIIEETITVYFEDSVYVPEIDDYVHFEDSVIVVIGTDTTYIDVPVYDYTTTCTTWYYYASDELENVKEQWKIQDKYTSMFVTGFFGNEGLWLTRQALNQNVTPDWWKINNAPSSGVKAYEFTNDGKTLFYSSWGGQLFRVKNLDQLWSAADVSNLDIDQIIGNAGGAITSIASDPNNLNHLIITVGGYGNISGGKVRESNNALSNSPTFSNIWDFSGTETVLERMPVYSSIIDVMDNSGNTIVVGTEFGAWASNDGGDTWQHTNGISTEIEGYPQAGSSIGSMGYVPVFDLRQQQIGQKPYMNPQNYGVVYAGTHGRGIFRSDDFYSVGVSEVDPSDKAIEGGLIIYPNPTSSNAYIDVDLLSPADNVQIQVYTITGQLVNVIRKGRMMTGEQRISLESEELPSGNYIVRLQAGDASGVGKFIKY